MDRAYVQSGVGPVRSHAQERNAASRENAIFLVVSELLLPLVVPYAVKFETDQRKICGEDRFGDPVRPREWFLVPLHVIDDAVQAVRDGSITGLVYDPKAAHLVGQRPS